MGMDIYINYPISVKEVKTLFSQEALKRFDEIRNTINRMEEGESGFRAINSVSHKSEFDAVKNHFSNCVFLTLFSRKCDSEICGK
jgi:hypothetical protein